MGEMLGKMQDSLTKTSGDFALFLLKVVSGTTLGLTFALIMQELLGKADNENLLAFFTVIIITIGVFLRIAKEWGLTAVLVFDLVCILLGMVLKLYIMVAPGA